MTPSTTEQVQNFSSDATSFTESSQNSPRSPSRTYQQPNNAGPNEQLYILTIKTDEDLQNAMNDLRRRYFPPQINRTDAHLTLFHALAESKLKIEIYDALEKVASNTAKYEIAATKPFKLSKGIAIGIPSTHGGSMCRKLHSDLQTPWNEFLSQQDRALINAHYTIMNKVDDREKIDNAFEEVTKDWHPVYGTAIGLTLWKYFPQGWEWSKDFLFEGA